MPVIFNITRIVMSKRSTYNVTESRKLKLERLAVNVTTKLGKPIAWTEIIGFMIDNYSKEAMDDYVAQKLTEKNNLP